MAGGGGSGEGGDEDPVPVNCVALIDIIFCLCIFFMCSFHFKQTEGKIDSWLPRDRGVHPTPVARPPVLDDIRVLLDLDERTQSVVTRFGAREVASDDELVALARESYEEIEARRPGEARVEIDAASRVPWKAVVRLMDRFAGAGLKVEFTAPRP
ncbi:MAG TPA: biopolymer transporter ExbD [Planctomycetota bacterium]|nr:biopolymer transporter ExbD [Planctomycetota bacterium]